MQDYYKILGVDINSPQSLQRLSYSIKLKQFQKGNLSKKYFLTVIEAYTFLNTKHLRKIYNQLYKKQDIRYCQDTDLQIEIEKIQTKIKTSFNTFLKDSPIPFIEVLKFLFRVLTVNLFFAIFDLIIAIITKGDTLFSFFSKNIKIYIANILMLISLITLIFSSFWGITFIVISGIFITWEIAEIIHSFRRKSPQMVEP